MARTRALRFGLAVRVAFLLLALLLLPACDRAGDHVTYATGGALLPELGPRQDRVDRLVLRGAGGKPLVRLERIDGEWRLRERDGARADTARIAKYLLDLANAKRVEAKTNRPALYPQIGVEDVASAEATGHELEIAGQGIAARLLIGKEHKLSGGRYVRVGSEDVSWLTDLDLGFAPEPEAWIEHRLLEVPIARVERVRVRTPGVPDFSLSSREDRFRLDDAPAGAMRDSFAGDAIAGALQAFEIEDVGAAVDHAPSRVLDFELVDGTVLSLAVVRDGPRDWARISASFDEPRAQAWAQQARRPELAAKAKAQVAEWNRRFGGRRYLLSQALAATLMQDHAQILDGSLSEPAP